MPRINAAGRSLEVEQYGPAPDEAPTLVLLHEGLGSVSTWKDWLRRLVDAGPWGVVAYSRAGYGTSDPIVRPRSLRYMHDEALEALPEVLDALGVERCVLVGHSDGGSIALIHAGSDRCHPSVRGLVTLAAHVFCEDLSVASIEAAKLAYETTDLRERLARHHADVDGAFWGWNDAWLDPDFRNWNLESYLPGIRVPTLIVQGSDDAYGTMAQVDAIEAGISAPTQRLILPGAGHAPHREATETLTAAVTAFVGPLLVRSCVIL